MTRALLASFLGFVVSTTLFLSFTDVAYAEGIVDSSESAVSSATTQDTSSPASAADSSQTQAVAATDGGSSAQASSGGGSASGIAAFLAIELAGQAMQKMFDNHANVDAINAAQQRVDELGRIQNAIDQAARSGNYDVSDYAQVQNQLAEATKRALTPHTPLDGNAKTESQDVTLPTQPAPGFADRSTLMEDSTPVASRRVPDAIKSSLESASNASGAPSQTVASGRILNSSASQLAHVDPAQFAEAPTGQFIPRTPVTAKLPELNSDSTDQTQKGNTEATQKPKPKLSDLLAQLTDPSSLRQTDNHLLSSKFGRELLYPTTKEMAVTGNKGQAMSSSLVFDHIKTMGNQISDLRKQNRSFARLIQILFIISGILLVALAAKFVYDRKRERQRGALMRRIQRQLIDEQAFAVEDNTERTGVRNAGAQYIYMHREKKQWYLAIFDKTGKHVKWNSPLTEGSVVALRRFSGKQNQNVVIGKDGVLTPTLETECISVRVKGAPISEFSNKMYA